MKCSSLTIGSTTSGDFFSLFFGVIVTFISLIYAALRISSSGDDLSTATSVSSKSIDHKKTKEALLKTMSSTTKNSDSEELKSEDDEEKSMLFFTFSFSFSFHVLLNIPFMNFISNF